MVIIVAGLLLLVVAGYIVTPFVEKNTHVHLRVSAEQRNNLETAIEQEIHAFRKRNEETSL